MILRVLAIGFFALSLASCDLPRRLPSGAPSVGTPAVVQMWEYPAGEFPAMCLSLYADGVAQFRGGFTFFNPGSWRQGSTPGRLVITLGGDTEFPLQAAQQELRAVRPALVRFDASRRELEFSIDGKDQKRIAVGGYYFYRTASCNGV